MAPLDDMSQPGTAAYDSDTLTVGDGTWDFTKNDFLLPNLVGLNFETMQFNGTCPSALSPGYPYPTPGRQTLTLPSFLACQAWEIASRPCRNIMRSSKHTA